MNTSSEKRLGYPLAEFARLHSKHPSWAYRLLYAGKIKAVSSLGRLIIPQSEVERIMATAEPYNPKPRRRAVDTISGEAVEA